jgi:drug/metabolite transporter (DMT)-like permease
MPEARRVSGRQLLIAIGAAFIAFPAHAHGQEVFNSIFAQLASVIAVVFVLFANHSFRRHWPWGLLGCVTGVGLSWWATGDMPYRQNSTLITAVSAVGPILFAVLAVLAATLWATYQRRSDKSLERTRGR